MLKHKMVSSSYHSQSLLRHSKDGRCFTTTKTGKPSDTKTQSTKIPHIISLLFSDFTIRSNKSYNLCLSILQIKQFPKMTLAQKLMDITRSSLNKATDTFNKNMLIKSISLQPVSQPNLIKVTTKL